MNEWEDEDAWKYSMNGETRKRFWFCQEIVIDFQDPSSSFLFQYTIMTQKRGTKINISKSNWDFDVRPKDSTRYIEINISADAMLHVNHRKNKGMGMKKPSSLMLDFSIRITETIWFSTIQNTHRMFQAPPNSFQSGSNSNVTIT